MVRGVLEAADEVLLNGVARELQETGTPEGRTAGWMIEKMASRPAGELTVVASYALQALGPG